MATSLRMNPKRWRSCVLLGLALAVGATAQGAEAPKARESRPIGTADDVDKFTLGDLLPAAWQKRPKVRFNVFTEMTPAGRERPEVSPEKPLRYFAPPGIFAEVGLEQTTGWKPPPWPELKETMERALAANGFLPVTDESGQRPDLLLVFSYGAHQYEPPLTPSGDLPPMNAAEILPALAANAGSNSLLLQDILERARFIGGPKVVQELVEAMKWGDIDGLLNGAKGEATAQVVELCVHTCYFVTATAYDFSGVEKKQKIPLWQTRMTIEANGLDIRESLKPLITTTGPMLGRETPEALIVTRRLDREGTVEIGTPVIVKEEKAKKD